MTRRHYLPTIVFAAAALLALPGEAADTLPTVALQNTGGNQKDVPFTFGQVFAPGALTPKDGLAARTGDGTLLPLQIDVKATHPGGSVRHAVVSGVLPALAAGKTATLDLVKAPPRTATPATLHELAASGPAARITLTEGKTVYTASLADALAGGKALAWLSGTVADEWIIDAPLKDAKGNPHPQLTARFGVRWYPDGPKQARVEFIVENDKTFQSARNVTYDVALEVNGKPVYTKTGLTHYHHARWHQFAWSDPAHAPAVNLQPDTAYLIATRAVPNYDRAATPGEKQLAAMAKSVDATNTGPMTIGPVLPYMPTTGGRIDIGSLPSWSVSWLLSMDQRARDAMMAAADGSGTWSIHLRDETTGYPVRTDNPKNAGITTHGNLAHRGPLPVPRCVNNDDALCTTPFTPDTAHEPSLAYLPYVVTGDYYYLEELQFWAASNPLGTDPGNTGNGQGLLRWQQVRAQAWSLRTLGQAAYITPDAHPLKAYFTTQVENNLKFYHDTYVVGNPNALGVYDGSGPGAFAVETSAPWQDDFLTWSFGYLNELGFEKALPILKWKARYVVGRMTAPGYCWIMASAYNLKFLDANKKIFRTFAELYEANYGGDKILLDNGSPIPNNRGGSKFSDLACASQAQATWMGEVAHFGWPTGRMLGYADSALGYPANMQPALAMAVDAGAPNAAKAWSIFMQRAAKPDYRGAPQWAIVPRTRTDARAPN